VNPSENELRRGLPRSEQAEMSILGICLKFLEISKSVSLEPADFYSERHRTIFEAIRKSLAAGMSSDLNAVTEQLRRDRMLEIAGGESYLMDLIDGVVSRQGWEGAQKIIADKAVLRRVIDHARELHEMAFEDAEDVSQVIARFALGLTDIVSRGTQPIATIQQAVEEVCNPKPSQKIIRTGIPWLDGLIAVRPGQLGIIAGRPGDGKSSLATQIAVRLAAGDRSEVLFDSLEMTPEEIAERVIAQSTDPAMSLSRITCGLMDDEDKREARSAVASLDLNFCRARTVEELRSIASGRLAHGRIKLIVVDYIQLMKATGRTNSRNEEIQQISQGLKALAMDLNIPVIALSQFSREATKEKPQLHHLRDSGSIEQDANWVMFVYTHEKRRYIEVAKNRSGPVGSCEVIFDGAITKFRAVTSQDFHE